MFALVFVGDILIYNHNLKEHVQHLEAVSDILQKHKMFKQGKRSFVEYLCHIIINEGVAIDPTKTKAVKQ
jgi:hypothetical protein